MAEVDATHMAAVEELDATTRASDSGTMRPDQADAGTVVESLPESDLDFLKYCVHQIYLEKIGVKDLVKETRTDSSRRTDSGADDSHDTAGQQASVDAEEAPVADGDIPAEVWEQVVQGLTSLREKHVSTYLFPRVLRDSSLAMADARRNEETKASANGEGASARLPSAIPGSSLTDMPVSLQFPHPSKLAGYGISAEQMQQYEALFLQTVHAQERCRSNQKRLRAHHYYVDKLKSLSVTHLPSVLRSKNAAWLTQLLPQLDAAIDVYLAQSDQQGRKRPRGSEDDASVRPSTKKAAAAGTSASSLGDGDQDERDPAVRAEALTPAAVAKMLGIRPRNS
jgi:hypothetical protein